VITVERPLGAWLWYHVLSHVNLGRDAANLWVPHRAPPWWVEDVELPLHPMAQFEPLFCSDFEHLEQQCGTLAMGFSLEAVAVAAEWTADEPAARHARFETEVVPELRQARVALWGGQAPPLAVLDVPALRGHARAATRADGTRVVATSLAEPSEHLLCQVLHEEMHPHTDPIVLQALGPTLSQRETQVGTAGWVLHQALETAAIEGGRQIIARVLPHRIEAYARWCARLT